MKYIFWLGLSLFAVLSISFGSNIAQATQPHLDSCDPPPEQPKKPPKK